MSDHEPPIDSLSGLLLRVFWLFGGNVVLLLLGMHIFVSTEPIPTLIDVVYWSVVGLIIAARFIDISYFQRAAESGLGAWRRHSAILLALAGLAWLGAHLPALFRDI